ncbi:Xanthine phosphoribosyltransferase [Candidatus Bilamarchaeum dharawalense]|uniref:Xanthine phosphoribosyltransferase n=1 Tax=Candidatus Bilamarchaeum dharawalense TaxID=2885759 RepID=A0A5E4LLS0_9ARCH|nr:Xanthine phosphoribosyltransferase [Candidatus Bilamarchaeum dharawalense]
MEFLPISWTQAEKLCIKLSNKVKSYQPDVLIGISRGGLVPVRILSDLLDIHDVCVLRVQFYRSIGHAPDEPRITQGQDMQISGKKVLVVDDISDTGKSLMVIKKFINDKKPREVKFATLHFKPKTSFKPDYYLSKTNKWVIYPWEKQEVARELKECK